MTIQRLLVEQQQSLATVTLNRPDVHNAFDEDFIREIHDTFVRLADDPSIRTIVLKGAGPSFCAGADLGYMQRVAGYSREENLTDARTLQAMFAVIAECPKATVAQVHGAAIGGGTGLVAACDIAVASTETKFAFSEVRLGLAPA